MEVKQGKYKGIKQAALYYEKSLQDPDYKSITVQELLNKASSPNLDERINASWMLLKIIDCHPLTLLENISKLNDLLKDENKEVVRNTSKIIEFLAYKDPVKIATSIPNIVDLLDDEDPQLRFTASLIFKAISRKYDKIVQIPKLLNLLYDTNDKTRLNAVETLIEVTDEHLDKIMTTLYQLLNDKRYQAEVIEIIFKISSKYPAKTIISLLPHLKHKNNVIRRFTLVFLNNFAGKNLDFLTNAIPELVFILQDKVHENRILASNLLLEISQDHSQDFKSCISKLKEFFKKEKGNVLLNLAGILINVNRNFPDQIKILPIISKRLEKFVKSSNLKISGLARQYLSVIHKWNYDYGPAIKICQDFIKKYPLEENFILLISIAQIYHVIGDFKNAIRYFLEASRSSDAYIRLKSLIMLSYDHILQNYFKDA
ncbi:MAG: HEAT repeat domain-containing protein, partial [Promethearchaeota archaeon]